MEKKNTNPIPSSPASCKVIGSSCTTWEELAWKHYAANYFLVRARRIKQEM